MGEFEFCKGAKMLNLFFFFFEFEVTCKVECLETWYLDH